jgi:hypothetical protein
MRRGWRSVFPAHANTVARTARWPLSRDNVACVLRQRAKTAKHLRDRGIAALHSRSSLHRLTCRRWREAQSRKRTMKMTWLRYCLCHLSRPKPRLMCEPTEAAIERMSALDRRLAVGCSGLIKDACRKIEAFTQETGQPGAFGQPEDRASDARCGGYQGRL